MVKAVEEATGYRVAIDTIEGIADDAQMISARPEMPVHSIRVNSLRLVHAEYIVAVQCSLLLQLWSDPARIPVFSPVSEKVKFLADRLAKRAGLAKLPRPTAEQTAGQLALGVLNQLRAMPLEISVTNTCLETCPDLQEIQADFVNAALRQLSEILTPARRGFVPEEVWRCCVSMNATMALNWSGRQQTPLPMLPYSSLGFDLVAGELLGDVKCHPERSSKVYVETVNAWAQRLGLRGMYSWEYRNGHK